MKELDLETGWVRISQKGSSIRARREQSMLKIKMRLMLDKGIHPRLRLNQKPQMTPIETGFRIIENN